MDRIKIQKINEKIVIAPGTLPKPIEDIYNKLKQYEQIGTLEELKKMKQTMQEMSHKLCESINNLPLKFFEYEKIGSPEEFRELKKKKQQDNWIPVSERLPSKEDANVYGEVMATRLGKTMIIQYNDVNDWNALAWQALPEPYSRNK